MGLYIPARAFARIGAADPAFVIDRLYEPTCLQCPRYTLAPRFTAPQGSDTERTDSGVGSTSPLLEPSGLLDGFFGGH